ncbi:MAG: RNase P modulator RnpM [Wujia sp.]
MAKQIPQRQCVGCREMKQKTELVRVIRTPEAQICLDKTGRKNGRGAYICMSEECLKKAEKSKALERSLKCQIPDTVYQELAKEMI